MKALDNVIPNWEILWPEGATSSEWSHSGIAELPSGEIVFAEPGGAALILLNRESGASRRVSTPTEDNHGILFAELDDRGYLWLADPGQAPVPGQVLRIELPDGAPTSIPQPAIPAYADAPWRPTSVAVVTSTGDHHGDVWIADGYGESLVHRFAADGTVTIFDAAETGEPFACPHGIAIDTRGEVPVVVIADRSNRRLVFYDLDGTLIRTLRHELITSPSSIAVRGGDLIVTELDGALLRIDERDGVFAIIPRTGEHDREGWPNAASADGLVRPVVEIGRLNSPHGVAVGADGSIYLTEWFFGGRQIRLTV
jgi:streptogramin lyase